MSKFYNAFPRELGRYRTGRANSLQDLVQWVNGRNGLQDQYTSVYGFHDWNGSKRPNYYNAVVDRIYWDADPYAYDSARKVKVKLEDPAKRVLRLSYNLEDEKVGHWLIASGSGLNVYGDTTDWPLSPDDKKKDTIRAIQEYYDDMSRLQGDSLYGDVARVSRIPGTVNLKFKRKHGRRYCIFTSRESIEDGSYIENMQTNNGDRKNAYISGDKPIDLMYWEQEAESYFSGRNHANSYVEGIDMDVEYESDWFCVNKAMESCMVGKSSMGGTNRDRFIVLTYLFNTGYTSQEALGICKQKFNVTTLDSMRLEGQLKDIYTKGANFPSPTTLLKEGRCNNCGMC